MIGETYTRRTSFSVEDLANHRRYTRSSPTAFAVDSSRFRKRVHEATRSRVTLRSSVVPRRRSTG
jgi:hypothetical protein